MESYQAQRAMLERALLGNEFAIAFIESLGAITQVWDDLYDGDPVDSEDINRAFWEALVALPSNPFYRRNFALLQPLVQAAITDWLDSNALHGGSLNERVAAYILRDTMSTLTIHCARIVGGYEWMRQIGPEVRRYLYSEPLAEFIAEHKDR